jgi:hypothetical protein
MCSMLWNAAFECVGRCSGMDRNVAFGYSSTEPPRVD